MARGGSGVLGVNMLKDLAAGMRSMFGGRSRFHENELASGVSDPPAELERQAGQLGADAVIGSTSTTEPWDGRS